MTHTPPFTRRSALLMGGIAAGSFVLTGCNTLDSFTEPGTGQGTGPALGSGSVKVALILPLSGTGAATGQSMRNAAELALTDVPGSNLSILVKDDHSTPEGGRIAAQQAIAEGAELILGPLFAGSVQSVGQVARDAGKPVIAFSTDTNAAARGVYLMSFLPQAETERIVAYAAQQGRRSIAALIPQTAYGNVVEAAFNEAAAQKGVRVAIVERFPSGQPQAAVQRIASVIAGARPQADALFIPETAAGLPAVNVALQGAGFSAQTVKPLGTSVWASASVTSLPALQGGWYAAPDNAGYQAFAARYRAKFGADPVRQATLAYDAVSLAAALVRTQGSQRFTEGVLTNSSGFAGADGVFRFRSDGTNDRALAVVEIRSGSSRVVSAAPKTIGG